MIDVCFSYKLILMPPPLKWEWMSKKIIQIIDTDNIDYTEITYRQTGGCTFGNRCDQICDTNIIKWELSWIIN